MKVDFLHLCNEFLSHCLTRHGFFYLKKSTFLTKGANKNNGPDRSLISIRGEAEDGKLRFGAFFIYVQGSYTRFLISG